MKYRSSLIVLLTFVASWLEKAPLEAQNAPQVVIYIQAKGLRSDLLGQYLPMMKAPLGFQHLWKSAFVSSNLYFPFRLEDPISALATLSTGAIPSQHNITSSHHYDSATKQELSVFQDTRYKGLGSSLTLSPLSLGAETFSDAVKASLGGHVYAMAIATSPEEALVMGGPNADVSLWIDPNQTSWASTSFYGSSLPSFISSQASLAERLSAYHKTAWKSNPQTTTSLALPYSSEKESFSHSFSQGAGWNEWRHSPLANEAITQMAIQIVSQKKKNKKALFLSLTWNLIPSSKELPYSPYSPEVLDAYMRMDQQLHDLIQSLDTYIGKDQYSVVIAGTPYPATNAPSFKNRRETTLFLEERCSALTNMYLSAIYGRGDWVKEVKNGSVFLNRDAIKKQNIDLDKIQSETALFISEMKGVDFTLPTQSLQEASLNEYQKQHYRSRKITPEEDVVIFMSPEAITAQNEKTQPKPKTHYPIQPTPLFILTPGVIPGISYSAIQATDIVPTLSYIFKIRSPSMAFSLPIFDIYQEKK